MNNIESDYNDLDSSWTTDFKEVLNNNDKGELLSDFLSELFKNGYEEKESDKHPLNELIKDIH